MEIFNMVRVLIIYKNKYKYFPTVSAIQIMHKWNSAQTW